MKTMEMMEPMLDCEAVMRQMWDYLDGELTPERTAAIHAHVAMCARCTPQVDFERHFLKALDNAKRDIRQPTELRNRVLLALRAEGLTGV